MLRFILGWSLFESIRTIPIRFRLFPVFSLAPLHALGMVAGFQIWVEVETAISDTGLQARIVGTRQRAAIRMQKLRQKPITTMIFSTWDALPHSIARRVMPSLSIGIVQYQDKGQVIFPRHVGIAKGCGLKLDAFSYRFFSSSE